MRLGCASIADGADPDRGGDEAQFKQLSASYEVLSDSRKVRDPAGSALLTSSDRVTTRAPTISRSRALAIITMAAASASTRACLAAEGASVASLRSAWTTFSAEAHPSAASNRAREALDSAESRVSPHRRQYGPLCFVVVHAGFDRIRGAIAMCRFDSAHGRRRAVGALSTQP